MVALFLTVGALPASALAAEPVPAPLLVHEGERLVVPAGSPLRQRLRVEAVGAQAAPRSAAVPAVVEADPARVVAVAPPATGRLLELHAGLGDIVRRGQPLAVIASPDFGQALDDQARAADALELARRTLERVRGVLGAGASAAKDLEAAETAERDALAEDRRARDRVATLAGGARIDMRSRALVILAPVSGTVTALNAGAGAYLNDATAPLLTVSALDRVFVSAQVPEGLLAAAAPGASVAVSLAAYPGQVWRGKVSRASAVLEPDTRRAKIRIPFDNADGRLKPNMFATASFSLPASAGLTVPASALLMNNDTTTVLVEVAPWTFVRRVVELGSEEDDRVVIASGLKPGERVVVRGGVLMND